MSYEDLSYFGEEEFKQHLAQYEEMLHSGRSVYLEADELTDIAEYYMMKGETEKATACIEYAMRLHPGSVDPLIFQARQHMFADDMEGAKAICNQITDQTDREVIFFNVDMYLNENYLEGAQQYIESVIENIDDDPEQFAYDIAYVFLDYNYFQIAEEWCEKALSIHPEDDKNLKLKAEILLGRNEPEKAIQTLNQALDINPYNIFAWHAMTEAYIQLNDYSKAIETVDFALAINEKDAHAMQLKANCFFYLNNFKEAHRYYTTYLKEFPTDEVGLFYDGLCLSNLQCYEEAIVQFKEGWKHAQPRSMEQQQLYSHLSLVYSKLGQVDEAIRYIEQANEIRPTEYSLDVFKGNIYLENRQKEKAFEYFKRALTEADADQLIENHFFIGISLAENEMYNEAEAHFLFIKEHQELDLNGVGQKIYSYLAFCALMRYQYEDFLKYLKTACDKDDPYLEVTIGRFIPSEVELKDFYDYVLTHPENFIRINPNDNHQNEA